MRDIYFLYVFPFFPAILALISLSSFSSYICLLVFLFHINHTVACCYMHVVHRETFSLTQLIYKSSSERCLFFILVCRHHRPLVFVYSSHSRLLLASLARRSLTCLSFLYSISLYTLFIYLAFASCFIYASRVPVSFVRLLSLSIWSGRNPHPIVCRSLCLNVNAC